MNKRDILNRVKICAAATVLVGTQYGCASTYSNLVSGNELGVKEYRPAVYVAPGNESKYDSVLSICRQVAVNRQITAAQEAQLETITGVTEGTAAGLSFGLQLSGQLQSAGLDDVDVGDAAMYGAAAGLLGSLASSFASGTEETAAKSREVLLNCLQTASNDGQLWQVLE